MEVDDPAFDPTPDLTPEPPTTIFDPAAVFDVEILSDEFNAELFVPDNVISRVDEPIPEPDKAEPTRDCNAEDATVEPSEEPAFELNLDIALEPTSDPRPLVIPDFDPFAESRVDVIPD